MTLGITKTSWGLAPASRETEQLVKAMEPGEVVWFEPIKEPRSMNQHRLYWLWMTDLSRQTGHSKDELHEHCKRKYVLPILVRDDEDYGVLLNQLRSLGLEAVRTFVERFVSTTDLSKEQFTELLHSVDQQAVSQGYTLRRPDDLYFEALAIEAERGAA